MKILPILSLSVLFPPVMLLTADSKLLSEDHLVSPSKNVMSPGRCFAGGRGDKRDLGGFAPSNNHPKKLSQQVGHVGGRDGQLELLALPESIVPIAEKYRGMRLLLVNRTPAEVGFYAADSRINLLQEAQDSEGNWKPIEYIPRSWCGNSYHHVFLPSDHFWEFIVPFYSGSMKTKMRFVLNGKLYSNEFEGSINPGQFHLR
jgi:hypothetical protein